MENKEKRLIQRKLDLQKLLADKKSCKQETLQRREMRMKRIEMKKIEILEVVAALKARKENGNPSIGCAIYSCTKDAAYMCMCCQKVHYCSKDHQNDHWINGHRELCKPCCDNPGCKLEGILRCTKCKQVKYCDKSHQKAHWPVHRGSCFMAAK